MTYRPVQSEGRVRRTRRRAQPFTAGAAAMIAVAGLLAAFIWSGWPVLASGSRSEAAAAVSTSAGGAPRLPTLSTRVLPPANTSSPGGVSGPISAPGGPYLYDATGRVIILHGVNVVYKHPPYEVYPDPGKAWNFDATDASLMARLGFNVVRLGMTWQGLEPGTDPANDPAICTRGRPGDPLQLNQQILDRYLGRLRQTVDLLGRYHIYTLLDMHQDVYNQMFDGEGEPNWAVCTDGVPSVDPPGRWSKEYGTAAAGIAFHHFWTNNVIGNLQGQYDQVWAQVARYFHTNPWVIGYDPFNEPFSTSLLRFGDEHFDAQLECFYTGTAHVGTPSHGAPAIRCPRNDPAQGVIATIHANDPTHLIFDEPDNYASRGYPTFIGPMDFSNLVFNVHIYCGARSPVTGNPTDIAACAAQDATSLDRRSEDLPEMASPEQPRGPAWFVSEFGATSNATLLTQFTADADQHLVGWAYWSWKYYDDPTGSHAEGLVMADGRLRSTARVLSRTYAQAIAGKPVSMSFTPGNGAFRLAFVPDHALRSPTVIFVPTAIHYPHGYCARVSGARVISKPGRTYLELSNARHGHLVRVSVDAGACRH